VKISASSLENVSQAIQMELKSAMIRVEKCELQMPHDCITSSQPRDELITVLVKKQNLIDVAH